MKRDEVQQTCEALAEMVASGAQVTVWDTREPDPRKSEVLTTIVGKLDVLHCLIDGSGFVIRWEYCGFPIEQQHIHTHTVSEVEVVPLGRITLVDDEQGYKLDFGVIRDPGWREVWEEFRSK